MTTKRFPRPCLRPIQLAGIKGKDGVGRTLVTGDAVVQVFGAALEVEAATEMSQAELAGYGFEQGGLATVVFARKEGNAGGETQAAEGLDCGTEKG